MALAPTVSLTGSNVRDGCARANRPPWICLVQSGPPERGGERILILNEHSNCFPQFSRAANNGSDLCQHHSYTLHGWGPGRQFGAPSAAIYPGPYEWFESGIRRYGFHGINHQYCAERAAQMLGADVKALRIVSCHLGNGCSVTAIRDGQSIDTTMGFTPLEGLMSPFDNARERQANWALINSEKG
jgi:hypothetical protein